MLKFDFEGARGLFHDRKYTQMQVDSINALFAEANKQHITSKAQMAYILATVYHECYNPKTPETRMTPIVEFGSESYLRSKKYYPYVGRGFVQLTWKENYLKYNKEIEERFGVNIMQNPELVLRIDISAYIAIAGMKYGRFTGKCLNDYINVKKADTYNARRIINGLDKAQLIADYCKQMYNYVVFVP